MNISNESLKQNYQICRKLTVGLCCHWTVLKKRMETLGYGYGRQGGTSGISTKLCALPVFIKGRCCPTNNFNHRSSYFS